jgi:leucine dehydrogenase
MTSPFESPEFDHHENVVFCSDAGSGLRAIIAIHDTTLGPAAGGCRMWPYASTAAALTDVLRLSRAMTYKNSLAGLPLGGGKSVIIGDARTHKTPQLLAAFARHVERLGGRYWTAEDVGIGTRDVEEGFAQGTRYIFGLTRHTGDPAPFTARGGFEGMRAAVEQRLGRASLAGVRVAVQGVGNVGTELCRLLHEAGAALVVCDVNAASVQRAVEAFGATAVAPEAIYDADVDVFAPCALGGVINDDTIPRLRATVVSGVANNQLAGPQHGRELQRRGVLYAPDFLVNAGGMHNASGDILGRYDRPEAMRRVVRIYDVARECFARAAQTGALPEQVAEELARQRIAEAKAAAAPRPLRAEA